MSLKTGDKIYSFSFHAHNGPKLNVENWICSGKEKK